MSLSLPLEKYTGVYILQNTKQGISVLLFELDH
jgi:hypothetical protein